MVRQLRIKPGEDQMNADKWAKLWYDPFDGTTPLTPLTPNSN
jgi:hypothetical protein